LDKDRSDRTHKSQTCTRASSARMVDRWTGVCFCVFHVCIYIDLAALTDTNYTFAYLYLYFNDTIDTACLSKSAAIRVRACTHSRDAACTCVRVCIA